MRFFKQATPLEQLQQTAAKRAASLSFRLNQLKFAITKYNESKNIIFDITTINLGKIIEKLKASENHEQDTLHALNTLLKSKEEKLKKASPTNKRAQLLYEKTQAMQTSDILTNYSAAVYAVKLYSQLESATKNETIEDLVTAANSVIPELPAASQKSLTQAAQGAINRKVENLSVISSGTSDTESMRSPSPSSA